MIQVRCREGSEARALVDPFYESHDSRGRARDTDLFFLAYDEATLIGCVRYCVEEGTSLLRSLMIHKDHRQRGTGYQLLNEFAGYLDRENVRDVFCLPYLHLENFYGSAGFIKTVHDVPLFLEERMKSYDLAGSHTICMRRP